MSRTRDGAEIWFVEEGPSNRMILSLRSPVVQENDWALERLLRASSIHNERFNLDKWHSSVEALLDWPIRLLDYAVDEGSRWGDAAWECSGPAEEAMRRRAIESLLVLRNAGLNEPMNGKLLGGNAKLKRFLERFLEVEEEHLMDALAEPLLLVLDIVHNMAISSSFDLSSKTSIPKSIIPLLRSKDRAILTATFRVILALVTETSHNSPALIQPTHPIIPRAVDLSLQLILLPNADDYQLRALALDLLYECTTEAAEAAVILRRKDVAGLFRIFANGLYEGAEERMIPFDMVGDAGMQGVSEVSAGGGGVPSRAELEMMARQPEPKRSIYWISRQFVSDPNSHATQASVWQAYLAAFEPLLREPTTGPLLTGPDVISNVSVAFPGSEPMTTTDQPPIYVIKGIKTRESMIRSTPGYNPNPTSRPVPNPTALTGPPTFTRLFTPLEPSTQTPIGPSFTSALVLRNLARSLVELLAPPPSAEEEADAEGKGKKERKVREGEMFGLPIPAGWTGKVEVKEVTKEGQTLLSEKEGDRARSGLVGVEAVVLDCVARGTEQMGSWLAEVLEAIAILDK